MKKKQLLRMGVPPGPAIQEAIRVLSRNRREGLDKTETRKIIANLAKEPESYKEDPRYGQLAQLIIDERQGPPPFDERKEPARYKKWGTDLDPESVKQMENACRLPVAVSGALMPDAHVGYGLPIGGVLATENAVIPYAVGVDIACRMKMTVLDLPAWAVSGQVDRLKNALLQETEFGIGAKFRDRRDHEVMDEDWNITKVTSGLKDKAWSQLGTSGSGNHFVEFGLFTLDKNDLGLKAGQYLALLSHSGSRGSGANVASHYSKLAKDLHPELPKQLKHLAWLDLDSEAGQEYWEAMQLMGRYASANHELIHYHIARNLKAKVLLDVENHHNFAWKEKHHGREVIVHRKGATPAAEGQLGIIPGSMGAPGFIIRGRGNPAALMSAAHGAGRRMSRKAAKQSFSWGEVKKFLESRQVTLLSAGLDEAPMAYKDIESVMAEQEDLVKVAARFDPRIVRMAPAGERPED
jgi:tRNA-splicing ligase RtcB (3'-phosphate/5'-hydroxy nucleic acid ligase)